MHTQSGVKTILVSIFNPLNQITRPEQRDVSTNSAMNELWIYVYGNLCLTPELQAKFVV